MPYVVPLVLVGAGLFALAVGVQALVRGSRTSLWQGVAGGLGLTLIRGRGPDSAGGMLDGVHIALSDHRGSGEGLEIEAVALAPIPGDLRLERQGFMDGVRQLLGDRDLQVGDPAFDAIALVGGGADSALAALDSDARASFARAAAERGHLSVRLGTVQRRRAGIADDPAAIRSFARETAVLARRLSAPAPDVPRLLRERVERDPAPGVRLAALEALVSSHPRHPEAAQAVEVAASASDVSLRSAAGRAWLCLPGSPPDGLLRRLLSSDEASDRLAAAEAVGRRRLTGFEAALIELLADPSTRIRRAAAEALSYVGSLGSVAGLLALADRRFASVELRQAARHAAAVIQARHGSEDRGALALAQGGQVALAQADSGDTSPKQTAGPIEGRRSGSSS